MLIKLIKSLKLNCDINIIPTIYGGIKIEVTNINDFKFVFSEISSILYHEDFDEDFQITTNKENLAIYIDPLE